MDNFKCPQCGSKNLNTWSLSVYGDSFHCNSCGNNFIGNPYGRVTS